MTLGKVLRDKRLELGKSIEQISAATRIHARILQALEEDRYVDLPARTFTRGFITSYCRALRLDPEQVFKDHHDFLEQKFAERADRDQGHQGYVFEGKELEQNKRWMIIAASVTAFFAIAVLLVFKPQNHKRKEKHKEFTEEVIASATPEEADEITDTDQTPTPSVKGQSSPATTTIPTGTVAPTPVATATIPAPTATPKQTPTPISTATPKPTATPASTPNASASASATPKADPMNKGDDLESKEIKKKIAFEALEDVFVKYRSDNRAETQFILRKGRFLVIKAKEKIIFQTAKPEALRYRTKTRVYEKLEKTSFSVENDGSLLDQ